MNPAGERQFVIVCPVFVAHGFHGVCCIDRNGSTGWATLRISGRTDQTNVDIISHLQKLQLHVELHSQTPLSYM